MAAVAQPQPALRQPRPRVAEPVHAANGNDAADSVHHRLFGSPVRNGAPPGESPANGKAHKAKAPTVNERGHAIIRSVC